MSLRALLRDPQRIHNCCCNTKHKSCVLQPQTRSPTLPEVGTAFARLAPRKVFAIMVDAIAADWICYGFKTIVSEVKKFVRSAVGLTGNLTLHSDVSLAVEGEI